LFVQKQYPKKEQFTSFYLGYLKSGKLSRNVRKFSHILVHSAALLNLANEMRARPKTMTTIKRSALVAFTARQMFELVNNIKEYPRFLPWCHQSTVLHQAETEVEASIDIAWSGIHKSFTTRNYLYPDERIDITLTKGPFRHLEGRWSFIPYGDHGCKINLDLEFEFTGHLIDKLFQPIFHHIANSLVDAFCKRAADVYANR